MRKFFKKRYTISITLCATLATLLMTSASLSAQDKPLPFPISLNSMILFALHENPDITLLQAREQQSSYAIDEKRADLRPQVDLTIDGGREFNDPSSGGVVGASGVNNTGGIQLSLSQLIFDGFKTSYEIKSRENLNEAAALTTNSAVNEVINETVENYLKAIRFQEDAVVLKKLLGKVKNTVATIEELFDAGASAKAMRDYARSREAFVTTEVNRAQSSLNDAISNLEFLAGKLPPGFIATAPEELSPNKLNIAFYLKAIDETNNNVLASEMEILAMEETLKAEKSKYYPSVSFNAVADQSHNDGGTIGRERELSGKFRLNYQLFDGGKKDAAVGRIKGQVNELTQKKRQVLKDLRREVKLAYNQIEANRTAIALTDIEITSNRAQTELNEQNFKAGAINVIDLIEGNERLKEAHLKKNQLVYEMYLNSYSLLILTNILDKEYFCETCLLE